MFLKLFMKFLEKDTTCANFYIENSSDFTGGRGNPTPKTKKPKKSNSPKQTKTPQKQANKKKPKKPNQPKNKTKTKQKNSPTFPANRIGIFMRRTTENLIELNMRSGFLCILPSEIFSVHTCPVWTFSFKIILFSIFQTNKPLRDIY